MNSSTELRSLLNGFTGSVELYTHALVSTFTYTEGVRAFAQEAGGGAYWLLDILATEPAIRKLVKDEGFAGVALVVEGGKGVITVTDGGQDDEMGNPVTKTVFTRELDYTDCPAGTWEFFLGLNDIGGKTVITALLPGEY